MEGLQEQKLLFPDRERKKSQYQIIMFMMEIFNFGITTYNCLILRNSVDQ